MDAVAEKNKKTSKDLEKAEIAEPCGDKSH